MEIVDDIKGIFKAAGTQIKSRIIGSEQSADSAEESPQENAAVEAKVDEKTECHEQQEVFPQSATNGANPVIDRVFQLRENFVTLSALHTKFIVNIVMRIMTERTFKHTAFINKPAVITARIAARNKQFESFNQGIGPLLRPRPHFRIVQSVNESPFKQDELVKMLEDMLPRLDELKKRTLAYAEKQDFCSRAEVFANILEKR